MAIQVLGIGSGLPLNELIQQLEVAERMKLAPMKALQDANKAKISAFGFIQGNLSKLQESVQKLNTANAFSPLTAKASGQGIAVAAGTTAQQGSYSVTVSALAQAQSVASTGFASKTDALTGAGTLSLTVGANEAIDITIDEGSTLEAIRNKINNSGASVSASIVDTGEATDRFRLVLSSKETGTDNQVEMSFAGTGDLVTALSDADNGGTVTQTQAASNAMLNVNGIDIVSQSNTVRDAIQGVAMTLSATGPAQNIVIARDGESVKESITAFVDAYNSYVSISKNNTRFNPDPAQSGKLIGDSTLRKIESDMRIAMSQSETGDITTLSGMGISMTPDGKLKIDDAKLTEAIADKPEAINNFFVGTSFETGYAGRLNQALEKVLRTEGTLDITTKGLNTRAESMTDSYKKAEESIDRIIDRYRTQFAAMDAIVGQMNSMMSYLNQQFSAMDAQLGRK